MTDVYMLARGATEALLEQKALTVHHKAGWERDGFPLPIKRMPPLSDGSVVQDYRPLAVLEYVQEVLSVEISARKARDRKAKDRDAEVYQVAGVK
jgi:hypothetical protein